MADEQKKTADAAKTAKPAETKRGDDDVVGKAYDGRLMRRLFRYLSPYKLQVGISGLAIVLKAGSDVLGPYVVKVAVDTYFAPTGKPSWLGRHLSPNLVTGIDELAALYFASLLLIFGLEFVQTYMMQWTGQKIMFDLRSQIFRHIQRMHVGFFDRNPVGRLVTRVTSDVDALNEMFTSGVLAIFEDVFVLAFIVAIMVKMSWLLALLTLAVIPAILYATHLFRKHVRESYRRQRAATAKINAFTQEYVSGMSVVQLFNREKRAFNDFSAVNNENKQAWTDAIFAYALYYPVVEFLSSIAIALVIWRGGLAVLRSAPGLAAQVGFLHPVVTLGILDCVHSVCTAVLPADPGLERQVQHSAGGDGGGGACVQAAGYGAGDSDFIGGGECEGWRWKWEYRVSRCVVYVSAANAGAGGVGGVGE